LSLAAADRPGVEIEAAVDVAGSQRDLLAAQRARALGGGPLSGDYGRHDLERFGAHRVHEERTNLRRHPDEVGVQVLHGSGGVAYSQS
jgi:hypothetical protein